MHRPAGDTDPSSAERDQIRGLVVRLEQAGPPAGPVDLASFLPPPGDPLYGPALRELVKCDLDRRWRHGRPVVMEEYLHRYPDLRTDEDALSRLLFEEFCARRRHGDTPALADYRNRFPEQFAALERLAQGADRPTDFQPPPNPPRASGPDSRTVGALLPVLGGYKLIKRIGSGSFGEVWQAEAPGGVEAAIKVIFRPLHHSEAKRELESLELMKRLRHPFLLQTQAFWPLEDRLLIAMELADGSIRDRLKQCADAGQSGIPADELLVYTREACEALDFLHSKKVLHRDIKPDNILLLEHHVKVADFGLARVLQAQRAKMTISGTPAFMPPETWSGKANEQSDQYSLAGSYVELRLNRQLFPIDDMAGAMLAHYQQTPDLDPLPQPEQQVLHRALAKDPDKRYPTCRAFWEALQQAVAPGSFQSSPVIDSGAASGSIQPRSGRVPSTGQGGTLNFGQLETNDGLTPPAPPPARPSPTLPVPRSRRKFVVVAAVVGLLAAGAVGVSLLQRTDAGPEVYLPDGFRRSGDAAVADVGGRAVYEQIAYALPDRTDLDFVLIPKGRLSDPEPFYMLRDKVTNHAFAQFERDNPGAVRDAGWKLGASGENDIPLGVNDFPFHPVMRVSVDDANRFAGWLKGRLPTAREWDKAAGRFDGAVGPFAGDGGGLRPEDLGVGLGRLRAANRGSPAATLFGCRDMAGNGYEWTCSTRADEAKSVPFDDPAWNDRVSLRGQTYFAPAPYRFADRPNSRYRFKNPENDEMGTSAEIGFRIMLELPAD